MKLSINEAAYLADKISDKTELGLFANIKAGQKGDEAQTLEQKNIYSNGEFSEEAAKILGITAAADKFARAVLKDSFCVIEKFVYKKGSEAVLVENDGGDLLFSMPDNWADVLAEFSEFTGISRLKSASFEILLPGDELMTLLAIIDINRRNALNEYMGSENGPKSVSRNEVLNQLAHPGSNSLVKMFMNNYNFPSPEAARLDTLLQAITDKSCVARTENGYSLNDEYNIFASRFLIPDTAVVMETLALDTQGNIATAAGLGLCAGIQDIALFMFTAEGTEFSSISGMQLMHALNSFLNCPDLFA